MRLREALGRRVDAGGLVAFRVVFGLLLAIGTLRLLQKGFVHDAFVVPHVFFAPWPFEGVLRPLPGAAMYGVYFALVGLAIAIAAGVLTRLAAALFCALFTYAHFVDLTNYLNHYWLVTLVTGILAIIGVRRDVAPAWHYALLRFQFGVVYVFAGIAKLGGDWLFRAQPMKIWLAANTDVPLIGPLLGATWVAYAASFVSCFYDLTVPFWLSWRRSRPFAFAAVVFFHLLTARLFNIGMFPYFMMAGSLLFLEPSWPRRRKLAVDGQEPLSRATLAALAIYAAVQLLVPLRAHLYRGNGMWHEQGYRFSWNVMRMEKMGSAEFAVVDRATGVRKLVRVRDHLSAWQEKAMATQPDLILAFAHQLARSEGRDVAVYADVFVVLNGRPAARLIDPNVDLARVRDGLGPKAWVLPAPP